ncbi:MAG: ABC transporter permease [Cyclobacteriaceae bacterium]
MLTYGWKFFVRSIQRQKLFSFLNIGGLSLGMAAFIYMMDYVAFEESFDDFHADHERIFRITSQKTQDGIEQAPRSSASVYLASFLKETFPELESVSRVHILDNAKQTVIVEQDGERRKFEETRGFHAGEDYFSIFSDKILSGNPQTAFDEPFKMVLTRSLALKYFDRIDVVGERVTLVDDEVRDYLITAVVEDSPPNSHFQYDYLISLKTLQTLWHYARWTAWNWDFFHTYVKTKPGVDPTKLEQRINSAVTNYGKEAFEKGNYSMAFKVQNIRDIHLYSNLGRELSVNGDGELLGYIKLIAFFVLILAWINYINLSTATSSLRAKEVGIRKVSGAQRSQLFSQFIHESLLTNFFSMLLAVGLVWLAINQLTGLTGHQFSALVFTDPHHSILLVSIILTGSLLAGIYPALVLNSYHPSKVLKGNFNNSKEGAVLRKFLVSFQFAISLGLMVGTMAIYYQVNFLRDRNLGIELDQVLVVNTPNIRTENFWSEHDYLRNSLTGHSGIKMMSSSNQVPGNILYHTELYKQGHQSVSEAKVCSHMWVDFNFSEVYDLELIAGDFFKENMSEIETDVVLNETAVKLLGFESPEDAINKDITWVHSFGALTEGRVLGVVNDFDQLPLGKPEPMAMVMNRYFRWLEMGYFIFKVDPQQAETAIATIEEKFSELYPDETFNHFFLDEHFNKQYQSEQRFGDVFTLFSGIAIFICNLGLFGLTFFILVQRKKEISVRKVLGASIGDLINLISKQFLSPLFWAALIAIPLVHFLINQWLQRFAYKVEISWWLYLVPLVVLVLISALITFWQTARAATTNPVENLRNE